MESLFDIKYVFEIDKIFWSIIVPVISSVTSIFIFERFKVIDKLQAEYEYEQKKKLKETIGRYHGRMELAARLLSNRMWNLYENKDYGWLSMNSNYDGTPYYFNSTVYRFLNVMSLVRKFEFEALYIDKRYAQRVDFCFNNYLLAFHWALTDTLLLKGIECDMGRQQNHFFADNLRRYSEIFWKEDEFVSYDVFNRELQCYMTDVAPVLNFFDAITEENNKLRWDRMVIFHVLLACFVNTFGYRKHYADKNKILFILSMLKNKGLLSNFIESLPGLGLDNDSELKKVRNLFKLMQNP